MSEHQDLASLLRAIDQLDSNVTNALRAVAWRASRDVRTRAQQILRSKTHGTGKTADSIEVIEEPEKKQFLVHVAGDPDRPANLPNWLEFGTRHMAARPFMRPAADAVNVKYGPEMEQAAIDAAQKTLGAD